MDDEADGGVVTTGTALDAEKAGRVGGGERWVADVGGKATALAEFDGCGVAGGVGCGVGLTTTTRGAASVGGVDGRWNVGIAIVGRGWATEVAGLGIEELTYVEAAEVCTGLGFAVLGLDEGAGLRKP